MFRLKKFFPPLLCIVLKHAEPRTQKAIVSVCSSLCKCRVFFFSPNFTLKCIPDELKRHFPLACYFGVEVFLARANRCQYYKVQLGESVLLCARKCTRFVCGCCCVHLFGRHLPHVIVILGTRMSLQSIITHAV